MNRLRALLRLRRRQESAADAALARAIRRRRDAEAARDALAWPDDAISTTPRPTSLAQLLAMRMQGLAALEMLDDAADLVAVRTRDEHDARTARTAAAVRRRSVERTTERREAEQLLIGQRAARRGLAELARLRRMQR